MRNIQVILYKTERETEVLLSTSVFRENV